MCTTEVGKVEANNMLEILQTNFSEESQRRIQLWESH